MMSHFKAKCITFAFHWDLAPDPIRELTALPYTHRGLLLRGGGRRRQTVIEGSGTGGRNLAHPSAPMAYRTTQTLVATPLQCGRDLSHIPARSTASCQFVLRSPSLIDSLRRHHATYLRRRRQRRLNLGGITDFAS